MDYLLSLEEVSLNAQNHFGETPLLIGVSQSDTSLIWKLINANVDVTIGNNECITPLHLAVRHNAEIVHQLIKNGAEINVQDFGGDTPLNEAVKFGTFEIVAMLLYYGADATIACENNISPLMFAIIREEYDMQEQLMEYEIDYNRTTGEGMNVLFLALTYTSPFTLELIKRGVDLHHNSNHLNALTLCLDGHQADLFKEIWDRVNYKEVWSPEYPSILKYAVRARQFDLVRYIIESKSIGDIIEHIYSEKTLMDIALYVYPGDGDLDRAEKLVYILLSHGLIPEDVELEYVYMEFGDGELFRTMLHMDVRWSLSSGDYIIPNIIHDIRPQITVKAVINRFTQEQQNFEILIVNMLHFVKHCIDFDLCQYFLQKADEKNFKLDDNFVVKLNRKVPSLLELSRNQVRYAICNKLHMTSCRQFYTYVRWMNIPRIVKDYITFKCPVYPKC